MSVYSTSRTPRGCIKCIVYAVVFNYVHVVGRMQGVKEDAKDSVSNKDHFQSRSS